MLNTRNTTVICIDLQEKLVNMLQNGAEVAQNASKLMKAVQILNLDSIVSEQYPSGLGSTIDEIKSIKDFITVEKTTFSAFKTAEFKQKFDRFQNKNIVIFGIETHICVFQSVIDLIDMGYNVFVVCDCCASRNDLNHKTALELMKQHGAKIVTLEILLFDLIKGSKHPNFKEIQGLIK